MNTYRAFLHRAGLRFCRLSGFVLLVLAGPAIKADQAEPAKLIKEVRCAEAPDQSYAAFLPSGYHPGRDWPILYCFDPAARGRLPVERFQAAAERLGYIVVGSNNSRNGDAEIAARAVDALVLDTSRRWKIDLSRRYAVGLSGGARVACAAAEGHGFAGVVANGAGFPEGKTPTVVPFAFFGVVGREDFNYVELRGVQTDLQSRPGPHRFAVFEGTHEWLPVSVAAQALEWIETQAMRSGLTPPNKAWLAETFQRQLGVARAQGEAGRQYEECVALLADFQGLTDTGELEAWIATKRESKPVRRYLSDEKKAIKEDERWRERLGTAISQALHGPPRRVRQQSSLATPGRTDPFGGSSDGTPGGMPMENGRVQIQGTEWRETDRFALLEEEVREARRLWAHNIAVRRALRAVVGSARELATEKILLKEYDEAGDVLKIATILQPEESGSYFKLAWVRALQGRKDEASQEMGNAIKHGFNESVQLRELTSAIATGAKGKTVLEPMFISTKREFSTSFGLGLTIYADPETREFAKILITSVAPDTEAAGSGLGNGEEILRVDGRDIHSFTADFSPHGDFARLFSKRRNGETIGLEIMDLTSQKRRKVLLTQGRGANDLSSPVIRLE